MAIVKASYTRSRGKIKATLRYIIHRAGREGERLSRTLFGWNAELTKEEAYRLIDAQRGMTYFHLKLNFHPKREDTRKDLDLRTIAKQTITTLQERLNRPIHFLAVEHNDHTALRHIHAIVIIKLGRGERIGREDWKVCREQAAKAALLERKALDLFRGYQKHMSEQGFRFSGAGGGQTRRAEHNKPLKQTRSCPDCAYKNPMVTLKDGKTYYCLTCGRVEEASPKLRFRQERELSL